MAGLLDFANTDEGMQGLGLLAAAAPQMAPMNFAGRLAQAAQGYQGMKGEAMKRLEMEQQIQAKNIALQQQQQQWAMQSPLMQALSTKMMQKLQPSQQVPQSDSQQPSMPFSGAPRDMLSNDPVPQSQSQVPQLPQQPMQSQSGGAMLPNVPDEVAMWALGSGGMAAIPKLLEEYNKPTDFQKMIVGAGIDPSSARGRQLMLDNLLKTNHLGPTRLSEGAYAKPDGTIGYLPSIAPEGYVNQQEPDGSYSVAPVKNGLEAVTASKAAGARGAALLEPQKVFNDKNGKYEFQTKATIADAANGVTQNGPVTNGNIKKFADINSINMAPPTIQDLNEINAALQSKTPRNAMQTQMLTQERDRIIGALNSSQQVRQPQQPQQAAAQTSGTFAAEPSLGTTANADAAQKATAQTMLESYKRLQDASRTAPSLLDAIAEMKVLAANKTPFVQSGLLGKATNYVSTDAAKYEKLRANVIAQLAANSGTNGSDKGRDLTGEMVPEYNKPTDAQQFGLDTLDRQVRTQVLKTQALTPNFKNGEAKAYTELESKFDQAIAPSLLPKLLPILSMPANASRGMLLKNLQNDPAMKKALTFAAENGLLK